MYGIINKYKDEQERLILLKERNEAAAVKEVVKHLKEGKKAVSKAI